jgi:phage terminase large subunit-like protein
MKAKKLSGKSKKVAASKDARKKLAPMKFGGAKPRKQRHVPQRTFPRLSEGDDASGPPDVRTEPRTEGAPAPTPPPPSPAKSFIKDRAPRDHVAMALEYARAVVDGTIDACVYVRQACARQINDLDRLVSDPSFAALYTWDPERAGRVCRFVERLPHVKGPKASAHELIVLEGWQCFILTTVFGWRRLDTGGRRFRRVYTEVPRGNAKSTLSSGVGLYCTAEDGEEGAEVYSAATTRDQAKIVWGDAAAMLKKRPDFAQKIGMTVPRSTLGLATMQHPMTNSKFEPLSRESTTMDGKNLHVAIVDELHAHKDRGIYDVLETAMAKRFSSMMWIITTAGSDTAGICYEVRSYVVKVLTGVVEDESQFGIVYTIDEDDDWTDPKVWKKANPNWGVSVMPDAFEQLAQKAMQVLSAQNNFKTKHLNIWVNADVALFDMAAWDRCGNPELREEDFKGQECVAAIDLASKTDMAAKAKIFKRMEPRADECESCGQAVGGAAGPSCETKEHHGETEAHFYGFLRCYLPEAALHDGRNASYEGWALDERRFLVTTPGDVIDFEVIKADVLEDRDNHIILELGFDPWQAQMLANQLAAEAIVCTEIRATVANFSAPTKELGALMLQGRFHHDVNPVARWMVSNCVGHYDAKENVYPRKERPENKIDGVIAFIMALSRLILQPESPYSPTRGFLSL